MKGQSSTTTFQILGFDFATLVRRSPRPQGASARTEVHVRTCFDKRRPSLFTSPSRYVYFTLAASNYLDERADVVRHPSQQSWARSYQPAVTASRCATKSIQTT